MKLTFSPQRRDDTLTLSRAGDVLTINGATLDLSSLPVGATLPREAVACEWLAGPVERDGAGVLQLSLILPHGPIPFPAPPEAAAVTHPAPITVTVDGPISLPYWDAPAPEQPEEEE